jgi:hypothetical protein
MSPRQRCRSAIRFADVAGCGSLDVESVWLGWPTLLRIKHERPLACPPRVLARSPSAHGARHSLGIRLFLKDAIDFRSATLPHDLGGIGCRRNQLFDETFERDTQAFDAGLVHRRPALGKHQCYNHMSVAMRIGEVDPPLLWHGKSTLLRRNQSTPASDGCFLPAHAICEGWHCLLRGNRRRLSRLHIWPLKSCIQRKCLVNLAMPFNCAPTSPYWRKAGAAPPSGFPSRQR